MTNFFRLKLLLLTLFLLGSLLSGAQSINYGVPFVVTDGASYDGAFTSTGTFNPSSMRFNSDGSKLFIYDESFDDITQYSLANNYDITSGVTDDGSPFSDSRIINMEGLDFSNTGDKMFVVGNSGSKIVQYDLSNPFDITSGVTFDAESTLSPVNNGAEGIDFSSDGKKMFIADEPNSRVAQFTLTTAFDISDGFSHDGNLSLGASDPTDLIFNESGNQLFIIRNLSLNGFDRKEIRQYNLTTPYDILSGVSFAGNEFDVSGRELNPTGIELKNGNIYVIGQSSDDVHQYQLNTDENFSESAAKDGSVDGSLTIYISGDTFANAGGPLTFGANYGVSAIPAGLTVNMSVASDGASATLTFSGSADDHQAINSLSSLVFTFFNTAFTGGNAAAVANSSAADSQIGIDFDDNPALTYSSSMFSEVAANNGGIGGSATITITGDTFTNSGSTLTETTDYSISNLPVGLSSSLSVAANGLSATLSFSGSADDHEDTNDLASLEFTFENSAFTTSDASAVLDAINAASTISIDFNDAPEITYGFSGTGLDDLNNTVTFDGDPYVVGSQEFSPEGLTFNSDGTKMYVIGEGDEINQYSLAIPFDITTGVNFDNSPFDVTDDELIPRGLAFSSDGSKLFIVGSESDEVNQYALSNAFDITSGVTHVGLHSILSQEKDPQDIVFNNDGSKMFIIGTNGGLSVPNIDEINQYTLSTPFDITSGVTPNGVYTVSEESFPTALGFNADGTEMFVLGDGSDRVYRYTLSSPYDITSTVTYDGNSLTVNADSPSPRGIAFNSDNSKMFVLTGQLGVKKVTQYSINGGGFEELPTDVGSVRGALTIRLSGETFTSANSNLTPITDYEITNLPAGLSSNIAVAADGLSAVLTLNGSASSHEEVDDVASLQFTFENSAFTNVAASNISNATSAASGFGIDFINISEAPTDISLSSNTINENEASGTAVGSLSTTDADAGETYTYTLVTGTGDADNGSFSIVGDELQSAAMFDFETKETYLIRINTNDGNGGDFEKAFTISVNNVFEAPTDILITGTSVDENTDIEEPVGDFSTTDVDAGETYAYTFVAGTGDTDNASFDIIGQELVVAELFDFETKASYSIRINTNDGNGGNFAKSFTISVNNVFETPTNVVLSNSAINENEDSGTAVGSLSTTDEDAGETYTYALAAGTGDADNGSFSIVGEELQSAAMFDFETKPSYSIRINTNDGNGGDFAKEFTITINDVEESIIWSGSAWSNGSGPTATDDVIINGTYTYFANGSFTCKDLTINSDGFLVVNVEGTLEVNGDIVNSGSIRITSGSSLISYGANTISGNDIEIIRNTRFDNGQYSFVGTPVEQNTGVTDATIGDNVYYYDETESYSTNDGLDRWDVMVGELVPGTGYTQANQQAIIFNGVPNTGTITYTGTYTDVGDNQNKGWNLVANPYAAAINTAAFLTVNDHISGAVYIWDDNGSDQQRGDNSDYLVANETMATSPKGMPDTDTDRYNDHLGSAQAFFVKLDDATDKNIVFTEGMRRGDKNADGNFYRETELPITRINLTNSEGLFKQTVIGFAEDATENNLNRRYDAQAFNASSDFGLFTMKAGRSLTLNGMTEAWEAIQLQHNAKEAGLCTISVELEGYDQSLFLKDNQTGDVVDLRNESYTFSASAGIDNDRFQLLSNPQNALGLDKNEVLVYAHDNVLYIQPSNDAVKEYFLFDMNGKQLLSTSASTKTEVNLSAYPSGVYLVFDGQKTHKIILK